MVKKLIILFLFGLSLNSYGQFGKNFKYLNVDTINALTDSVWIKSPTTISNDLKVRDTSIVDLIKFYGGPGSTVTFGNDGQLPFMNVAGTDFEYRDSLEFTGDSLLVPDVVFKVGSQFEWNGKRFNLNGDGANIFIGTGVGSSVTSGSDNVAIGYLSGEGLTTGISNSFLGFNAGNNTTGGSSNVFIGRYAGYDNTTSDRNIYIGQSSGENATGASNLYLGFQAGFNSGSGSGNLFLGYQAGYSETGSSKLYIETSSSTSPLIKGDFSTDELWFNVDTLHNEGHLVVDSNLYVNGRSILDKYELAAYTHPDSTVTTALTTDWTFVGDGEANKFTNIYNDGFGFDGDTLYFIQSATDNRDSVEFRFSATVESATSNVNKTVYHSLFIKHVGESTYSEVLHITTKARTATAGVYYPGPVCTTMPIFLKDGDKIQIRAKCAASTTTLSSQGYKVYLREE